MKNKLLLFLFQLLFVFTVKAQELKIGISMMTGKSVQSANWDYYNIICHNCGLIYIETDSKWSTSFRFSMDYSWNNIISIESGLALMNRGLKMKSDNLYVNNISYYYTSVPFVFNYHFRKFYFGLGTSANFFIKSKKDSPSFNDGSSKENDLPKQHNKTSLALISQIGYNFPIHEKVDLNCGLYYDYLFAGENIAYHNYGVNLGIRYSLYKKP